MAVKKSNVSGSRKSPAKKSVKTAGKKTSSKGTKKKNTINIDKTPIYVLSIMILFTVVILLINKTLDRTEKRNIKGHEDVISAGKNENIKIQKQQDKNITEKEAGRQEIIKETAVKDKKLADEKSINQSEFFIYLVRFDKQSEMMSLMPVKRNVKPGSPLADTLKELIKGPSTDEKARGLLTAVPANLQIRDIQVIGRNAVLDFNESIEENADGQILLTRIDQLVYTATQFEGVDGVIIKVNGRRKEFLGGEGLSVSKPIGRRNKH